MAYRRRQGIARASTFKEEIHQPINDGVSSSSSPSSSLAAKAIRASNALRESSFSLDRHRPKEFSAYEDASDSMGDSKSGFWGVLARKAKAILEEDVVTQQHHETPSSLGGQSNENVRRTDNHKFRKGLDAITTSLNHLGDTFEKAFEEGRNKTADIIQETRKLQIKRPGNNPDKHYQAENYLNDLNPWQQQSPVPPPQTQTNHETQLKASRDVAMATAAKAKLLLRELKTVKADLAFAKERCSQLEEENKMLRENRDKGDHREDEDLIRLQLETLLAEKARLANENSIYARENRFLREIIEYHQLTMQDVVYLDEGSEEVTEVHPITGPLGIPRVLSSTPRSSTSEDPISAETPLETETEENYSSENPPKIEDSYSSENPPKTEENYSSENQPQDSSLTEEDTNKHLESTK